MMYVAITGATSGIGKELAYQYAKIGHDLILTGRREQELKTIQADLHNQYTVQVQILKADLSILSEVEAFYQFASPFEPEIVINNAGFGIVDYFIQAPLERELSMIQTNIIALHVLTKRFLQSMKQGVILNVASMAGLLPTPKMAAYAATKAYVNHFSNALDYECKHTKPSVSVLSLCPGPVYTEFAQVAGVNMALKGISAKHCAKVAIRGIKRRKRIIIPSFSMKMAKFFTRFLPLSLSLFVSHSLQKKK